jgi:hypothetical protein
VKGIGDTGFWRNPAARRRCPAQSYCTPKVAKWKVGSRAVWQTEQADQKTSEIDSTSEVWS